MKDPFLIMYRIDTHSGRHNKSSAISKTYEPNPRKVIIKKKMNLKVVIPAEISGFFEGTPKARFLVTQTLTGSTVFSRAIDSCAPIQVLVVIARVLNVLGFWRISCEYN